MASEATVVLVLVGGILLRSSSIDLQKVLLKIWNHSIFNCLSTIVQYNNNPYMNTTTHGCDIIRYIKERGVCTKDMCEGI